MEYMGMKHAKDDYFSSLTSRQQFYTSSVCCRFMLRVDLFSEMPKYTQQSLQDGFFFSLMSMISHIGISQIAGECYSFNTTPIACQGAGQLMCSSSSWFSNCRPWFPSILSNLDHVLVPQKKSPTFLPLNITC